MQVIQQPNRLHILRRQKAKAAARTGSQEPPASAHPWAPDQPKPEKKPRKSRKKK